jgi:hypothetical protein
VVGQLISKLVNLEFSSLLGKTVNKYCKSDKNVAKSEKSSLAFIRSSNDLLQIHHTV